MNRRAAALPTCSSSATTAKYRSRRSSIATAPNVPLRPGHVVEDLEPEALADRQHVLRAARRLTGDDAGLHEEVLHLLRRAQDGEVAAGPPGEVAVRVSHAAGDVRRGPRTTGDLRQPV